MDGQHAAHEGCIKNDYVKAKIHLYHDIYATSCMFKAYGHEIAGGTALYSVLSRITQTSNSEMYEVLFSYKGAHFYRSLLI